MRGFRCVQYHADNRPPEAEFPARSDTGGETDNPEREGECFFKCYKTLFWQIEFQNVSLCGTVNERW